jgi:hypothetical protein
LFDVRNTPFVAWMLLQILIVLHIFMTGNYIFLLIPLGLIALSFIGYKKMGSSRRKRCKHKNIIHTKNYDYCYDCGEKIGSEKI